MPLLTYIPQILEEHFEELAFLLHLRAHQIGSGKMLFRQFIDLDDRIQGHIDGLLVSPDGTRALAEPALAGDDPLNARAAAYILLALGPGPTVEKILAQLANPALTPAVVDAMLLRRAADAQAGLKKIAASPESPLMAAMAMTILAEHFPRDVNTGELSKLLAHAEAHVRAAAWRAAARLPEPRPAAQYRTGCNDKDPASRNAAMQAAAWSGAAGQALVLDAARPLLARPSPESLVPLHLFAAIAPPTEASHLTNLAKAAELGPSRFDLLATSGLPAMVPILLTAMRQPEPASAAAAADAFARLTHYLPPSRGAVAVAPPGEKPDAFEKEFLPEAQVPDPDAAQKHWSTLEPALAQAPRISRGIAVDPMPPSLLDVDCAARDAILLRHSAAPEGRKFAPIAARWSFPQRSV
jgi:uncharacterized protein (TIGR02270 family)